MKLLYWEWRDPLNLGHRGVIFSYTNTTLRVRDFQWEPLIQGSTFFWIIQARTKDVKVCKDLNAESWASPTN